MERIVEASSVVREIVGSDGEARKQARVITFKNGKVFESAVDGDVFVMNENGKTVASYHLDKKIEN